VVDHRSTVLTIFQEAAAITAAASFRFQAAQDMDSKVIIDSGNDSVAIVPFDCRFAFRMSPSRHKSA
jgi:hypothetical protein